MKQGPPALIAQTASPELTIPDKISLTIKRSSLPLRGTTTNLNLKKLKNQQFRIAFAQNGTINGYIFE